MDANRPTDGAILLQGKLFWLRRRSGLSVYDAAKYVRPPVYTEVIDQHAHEIVVWSFGGGTKTRRFGFVGEFQTLFNTRPDQSHPGYAESQSTVIKSEDAFVRLLQISDLHFGPPYLARVGTAVLRSAVELKPDAVIVSGDLTQRAKRVQFEAAKQFLDSLPAVPRLVIPGNHDVPLYRVFERIANPHGLYREIISKELNPVLQINGVIIAGIDSTAPHTAISNGRIDRWQLDHVEAVFRNAPAELVRIIVAHHPFAPAHDFLRDKIVQKAGRAIEKFTDLNVELILSGHLHRAYIGNSLDFYPGTQRDRGIIIGHCGTTTSRRGRGRETEKNSLNLIEISDSAIRISHFMYFDASDSFELTSEHCFRRRLTAETAMVEK